MKPLQSPVRVSFFLQLLLGVFAFWAAYFLLAVNEDIAATQRTMVNTVNYVKEQCNRL